MNAKVKNVLKYLLSLALAVVLVWFALRSVDWNAFLEGLKLTRWIWLVPFFAACIGALVFRTFRWRTLLRASGQKSGWLTVWDANNIGNMANVALPGTGELLRCGYVSKKSGYGNVFGTVIMERAWDISAIVLLIVLAVVLDSSKFGPFFQEQVFAPFAGRFDFSLWWLVAAFVVLAALFFWAVFRFRSRNRFCGRVAGAVASIGQGFASFGKMEHKWLFLLYTLGIWTMYLLMCYTIMRALPDLDALGIKDALFFTAIGNIASIIPVPGGIGAYHYLIALSVSSLYGGSWETGILFATLQHELHNVLVLALGVISYARTAIVSRREA